jgi:D-3-phosphoglycerate dehydrogenase / 2-oxoglutarate reductase
MQSYLIIDFDSTFVSVEALDELAGIALRGTTDREQKVAQIEAITRDGMEGKIGFGESLTRRLELFSARPEHLNELVKLLKERVTPSVRANREFFKENADNIYVMSGGFREFIVPVVREYGIAADHVLANTFTRDKSGAVTGCDESNPLAHGGGKLKALLALALPGRVVMVGDGYSDYEAKVRGAADVFIAFTENVDRKAVRERADGVARDFAQVVELVTGATETGIVTGLNARV